MYSYGPPHIAKQKQDGQLEHTYSSYVRIWDVAPKTCQRRWTIGRSGERGSGISVLAAWYDDDYIYIYIYICTNFIKHNRHFMSTYFLLDPFEFPYYFYRIQGNWFMYCPLLYVSLVLSARLWAIISGGSITKVM